MTVCSFAPAALILVALGLGSGCRPSEGPVQGTSGTPLAAGTTPAAEAALARIVEAERTLEFSGYRKTVHGLPGMHRETELRVARRGGRTLLEWGAGEEHQRRWQYRNRFRWIDDSELLLANYRVELPEESDADSVQAVAWRETRPVRIVGRRPGRPSLTLLVDRETWLPLHEQLADHEGHVVLTSWFENLEFGVPDDVPTDAEQLEAAPEATGGEATALLSLGWVPAGFEFVRRDESCGAVREYWSDGLAAFVVQQRPAEPVEGGAEAADGHVSRDERQGRVSFSGVLEGVQVRVTGYLAPEELEAVVRGLRVSR